MVNLLGVDMASDAARRALEQQMIAAYRDSLQTIQGQIARVYEKYSDPDGQVSLGELSKYNRLTNLERDIAQEMFDLTGQSVQMLDAKIDGMYQESYERGMFMLQEWTPFDMTFGRLSPNAVKAAVMNPYDRIGWKDRSVESANIAIRQIREEVTRGVIQGKDYGSVARAVAERTEMAATRAMRIVQTETHRASELGKHDAIVKADDLGLVGMKRVWIATPDERTRIDHVDADGQEVDVNDPFAVGGEDLLFPGDPRGSPGNVINCRCTAGVEIAGYPTEKRWFREVDGEMGEVKRYQTVNQWLIGRNVAPAAVAPLSSFAQKVRTQAVDLGGPDMRLDPTQYEELGATIESEIDQRMTGEQATKEFDVTKKQYADAVQREKDAGEQLKASFKDKTLSKERRKELYDNVNEAADSKTFWEDRLKDAETKYFEQRGKTTLDVLSELRSFGSESPLRLADGTRKDAVRLIEDAKRHFPTDWLAQANPPDGEFMQIKLTNSGRGYYSHGASPTLQIRDTGNTIHELMHRMEYTVRGLNASELEFFGYRTGTDNPTTNLVKLETIAAELRAAGLVSTGGFYSSDEVGQRAVVGQWGDAYVGKVYKNSAREVLTMGIQSLFESRYAYVTQQDPNLRRWILGIMGVL